MTDKQIIKEKGNQKCIFYNDDICRKGDKTRDCLNCARVEYHSLYKLNWENQERLESQLEVKEQECERLHKIINEAKNSKLDLKSFLVGEAIQNEYEQQLDQLKAENDELEKELRQKKMTILMNNDHYFEVDQENKKLKQTLTEIKEIAEKEVNERMLFADKESFCDFNKILQKISECEVGND
jgi:chromosome segregation ATPase